MTSWAKLWAGAAQCHFLWTFLAKTSLKASLFPSLALHLVGEGGISGVDYCQTHDTWGWTKEISGSLLIRHTHIPEEEETTQWSYLRTEGTSRDCGREGLPGREMKPIRLIPGWNATGLADRGRSWVDSVFHWEGGIPGVGRETLVRPLGPMRCKDTTGALIPPINFRSNITQLRLKRERNNLQFFSGRVLCWWAKLKPCILEFPFLHSSGQILATRDICTRLGSESEAATVLFGIRV